MSSTSESNQGQRNADSLRKLGELSKRGILDYLSKVQQEPTYSLYFEVMLNKVGLLPELESAGIVPVVTNPNPFNVESEEEQHEQWWNDHPEVGEKFSNEVETRELRLRELFMGAVLGHVFDDLFP